ncbi:pantoate--beta-alanine ligase [Demequina pelophila]|uniref:pantoate--beta-alanine ligase n=1 Tax=Demequina pelophila TaxID=1638984 RepID=UPI0007814C5E|nr:pantoate--beta-alanine ligase [Demequina pelophila]
MRVVHTAAELREAAPGSPAAPGSGAASAGTRAVVMTMGALHEGHLALVRAAREMADQVVVTVFVNPLQFNDPKDLESYPRTLEADCALLEPLGVDLVFAPGGDEVYPGGTPLVTVSAGEIGRVLEGAHRPGHFDGMLTVVAKLLHLTAPDIALFGQKDAQQLIAIRTMARDLNFPVRIEGVPTVRAADGLALSSRNVFLSPSERESALALNRALRAAEEVLASGTSASAPTPARAAGEPATASGTRASSLADALAAGRAILAAEPGVDVDYFEALDPATAMPLDPTGTGADYRGEAVIAVAARVGATRLIDNVVTRIGAGGDGAGRTGSD